MLPTEAESLARARVSPALAEHCARVAAYAAELARRWGADREDALLAGWLHDLCKELDADTVLARARSLGVPVGPVEAARPRQLLHAPLAAAELSGRSLSAACLEAIACHTTGRAGMGLAARCLYVADAAEPGRAYAGVERVRELAATDLQAAVAECAAQTLAHLVRRRAPIHPASLGLYNELHL
jgi:predicted HD superfamily hydrolase involved in NAD metabolism